MKNGQQSADPEKTKLVLGVRCIGKLQSSGQEAGHSSQITLRRSTFPNLRTGRHRKPDEFVGAKEEEERSDTLQKSEDGKEARTQVPIDP